MLIDLPETKWVGSSPRRIGGSMTWSSYTESNYMHVKGLPTAGMVDGEKCVFRGPMKVSGTYTYTTVNGAQRTLFSLEPLDITPTELAELQAD